jgi:hypothetical protein
MTAKEVRVGSHTIQLSTIRGEVTDEKKWATSSTRVYGVGRNVSVHTTNVEHDQFVLRESDGTTHAIRVDNARLRIAQGHVLTVVVGSRVRDDYADVLAVHNHTTGASQMIEPSLTAMLPGRLDAIIDPIMALVLSCFVAAVGVLGVAGGGYALVLGDMPVRGGAILLLAGVALSWLGWRGMTARGGRVAHLRRTVSSLLAELK